MFALLDQDRNGKISFNEFCTTMSAFAQEAPDLEKTKRKRLERLFQGRYQRPLVKEAGRNLKTSERNSSISFSCWGLWRRGWGRQDLRRAPFSTLSSKLALPSILKTCPCRAFLCALGNGRAFKGWAHQTSWIKCMVWHGLIMVCFGLITSVKRCGGFDPENVASKTLS